MMNRDEFVSLYESEIPMYTAWADYVLTKIDKEIKSRAGGNENYFEWVKIPPSKRIKSSDSLATKAFVRKRDKYADPYLEITDKAGVRFVVLLTSQLELLSDIVQECDSWKFSKDKEFDDWKTQDPRMFDYQSVHYVVYASDDIVHNDIKIVKDTPCEIQLRTLLQHAYAELAHDTIYKSSSVASPEVYRSFAKSMALMETTDELLCNAKAKLDEEAQEFNSWRAAVDREAKKRLSDTDIVTDNKLNDYVISSLNDLLNRVSVEEFLSFLDNESYSYIYDRIRSRQDDYAEFRTSIILLTYFLSFRFKSSLHRYWPLDDKILEKIYSDLGLTPKWTTT